MHVGHAAAGIGPSVEGRQDADGLRSFRGLYSNQLISMVERCLRLDSLERPQTVFAVQKELLQNVPERPEFRWPNAPGHAGATCRAVFALHEGHNITWF